MNGWEEQKFLRKEGSGGSAKEEEREEEKEEKQEEGALAPKKGWKATKECNYDKK